MAEVSWFDTNQYALKCDSHEGMEKLGDTPEAAAEAFNKYHNPAHDDALLDYVCVVDGVYYYNTTLAAAELEIDLTTGAATARSAQRFGATAQSYAGGVDAGTAAEISHLADVQTQVLQSDLIQKIASLQSEVLLLQEQAESLPDVLAASHKEIEELEKSLREGPKDAQGIASRTLLNIFLFGFVTSATLDLAKGATLLSSGLSNLYYLFQRDAYIESLCAGTPPKGAYAFNKEFGKTLLKSSLLLSFGLVSSHSGSSGGETESGGTASGGAPLALPAGLSDTTDRAPSREHADLDFETLVTWNVDELAAYHAELAARKSRLTADMQPLLEKKLEYDMVKAQKSLELIKGINAEDIDDPDLKKMVESAQKIEAPGMIAKWAQDFATNYGSHSLEIGLSFGLGAHVVGHFYQVKMSPDAIKKGMGALDKRAFDDAKTITAALGECKTEEAARPAEETAAAPAEAPATVPGEVEVDPMPVPRTLEAGAYQFGMLPTPGTNFAPLAMPEFAVPEFSLPRVEVTFNNPLAPRPAYAYAYAGRGNGGFAPQYFTETPPLVEVSYAARVADAPNARVRALYPEGTFGGGPKGGTPEAAPKIGGGTVNLNPALGYVAGSALFLGVGYAGGLAMDSLGVPEEWQYGIGMGYTVGGVGYGLHSMGAAELAQARAASGVTLAPAAEASAYGLGVARAGGAMAVSFGAGELSGQGAGLAAEEMGFGPEAVGYAETGASVVGGLTAGGAFLATASYLSLSTPVTAVAALGLYGACKLGSYFIGEYRKGRALDRAESDFRAYFAEQAEKEPGKKWEEILSIFDEMKAFCESELTGENHDVDLGTLREMTESENYRVVSAMMGWWFHEKYFAPFLATSAGLEQADAIVPLLLDLKFPGLADVVDEFSSHLTTSMTKADVKELQAIVADPANVMLFEYAGAYVVEETLDPFLTEIGYYDKDVLTEAYEYATVSSAEAARREAVKRDFGWDLSQLKYDIEHPHAQPHIAAQEEYAARVQGASEHYEKMSAYSDAEAVAAYEAELVADVRTGEKTEQEASAELYRAVTDREFMPQLPWPTAEQSAWYAARGNEKYESLRKPYLTFTGSYDSTFFTEFPKTLAKALDAITPETAQGGALGAAELKLQILKRAYADLKSYYANLKSSSTYQLWYGDFSNDDDLVASILVEQIAERIFEFEGDRYPDQIDGIRKDVMDLFDVLAE